MTAADVTLSQACGQAEDTVLAVEGLSIGFGSSPVDLVDDVSFRVGRGRTLAIVGESGCGKSITSLALMGLLPSPPARIAHRSARFLGRDPLTLGQRAFADLRGDRMAMIFQEPMTSLNPVFTVGQQIIEGVLRHKDVGWNEARARAVAMLARVRIAGAERRLGAYPHELSGGMRQRVMIAMALVNQPDLLIADEPTTALDVTIQAQILSLIEELQATTGTAVLLITHDLGVVAETAHDVIVMYAGRVVESGPVEALFSDPQHPYTIGLMGAMPSMGRREGRLLSIPGAVPPPSRFPAGCRFATRCPFADDRCHAQKPPMVEAGPGHAVRCWKAPLEEYLPS
ncbi:ABC transporter ATP-binding protein [Telmatospirillum siberiense]|uniref:Dipeptide ABC transporter ATP-binding protein DppD n=1 Tax=Telmatospirillum siberiense TaxID=382514 RepID=A0A2N3PN27_9PROT|nr:ABC transporter ATP-binding protein [Telmatospirillum siberiense]PKU21809.1 dipeptide ABC transporter ATP-binding protein DppD [Telmatospirillum siberiense]